MPFAAERTESRTRAAGAGRLAVIDVGSNTARLDLYESTEEGGLRTITEVKEAPRLGQGLGDDGDLSPGAIERGVATLARFARTIEEWGNPRTVAVATSAVRDAPNGGVFVARVARETGITLRVLSGEEEARYGYLGAASAWPVADDIVVDLGGGSLQLTVTRNGNFHRAVSRPLGALRLTERFLGHDPPRKRELKELREFVRDELRPLPHLPSSTRATVYGIGGTIRSLARVEIARTEAAIERPHGFALTRKRLEGLAELLEPMTTEERREVVGLSSARADVVPAGIIILEELLRRVDGHKIVVTGTGIRSGLAVEVLGIRVPAPAEEIAWRSVTAVARGLSFGLEHVDEVRERAVRLFDVLRPVHRLGDSERLALSVAAWMHDSGSAIEVGPHARHSGYLIRHSPLLGLEHREILLASYAAEHSEGRPGPDEPMPSDGLLAERDLPTAEALAAILRVAEAGIPAEFSLGRRKGRRALIVRPARGWAEALAPDMLKRVERSVERTFGIEVGFRGR